MARIAIVGSGFIGRGWAISYARAGHDVVLWDSHPDAPRYAIDYIAGVLSDLSANRLLGGFEPEQVRSRLFTAAT
ncbi:MAG: 3-hydroxyacyl-CoA dehydrogenase NAD-binding domain-containing protein, partial [Alphaproteobacteria bacterium]